MTKMEELIEAYLNVDSFVEDELLNLMTSKPRSFLKTSKIPYQSLSKESRDFIWKLQEYTFDELYGEPMQHVIPVQDFKGMPLKVQWFILTNEDGPEEFLVDTEGFSYARYVARIIR